MGIAHYIGHAFLYGAMLEAGHTRALIGDDEMNTRIAADMDRAAMDHDLLYNWFHEPAERAQLADKLARIRTEMHLRRITVGRHAE